VPFLARPVQARLHACVDTRGGVRRIYCDAMTDLRFGQAAPDFSLPATTGGQARLADFRGRDVVLLFYCFDWGSI
jgi:hypothetical protein